MPLFSITYLIEQHPEESDKKRHFASIPFLQPLLFQRVRVYFRSRWIISASSLRSGCSLRRRTLNPPKASPEITPNSSRSPARVSIATSNPKANSFGLLVAMLTLAGLLLLFGVISGLAFGGFKVLLRRLHPERTEEAEMIHLDLK